MKKEHVKLTETDRTFLEELTKKGELKARAGSAVGTQDQILCAGTYAVGGCAAI